MFLTVLFGLAQGVLRLLAAPVWVRIAIAAVIAAVALLSEVSRMQAQRAERAEAERRQAQAAAAAAEAWTRSVSSCMRVWPPEPVGAVDPYELGVAKPAPGAPSVTEGIGRYVARDVDGLARERLQAQGLLLLVGAPASGVTRTAYECLRALGAPERGLRPRLVLAPTAPDGARRALDELDVLTKVVGPGGWVLWLDRIDEFTGDLADTLRRFRERAHGTRVVATIASPEYSTWAAKHSALAHAFGEPVRLNRLPSPAERAQAEETYPGVNFSEGIAAAFTGVGRLLERMKGGDPKCPFEPPGGDCDLAQAILTIAIAWQDTATPRPLTLDTLAAMAGDRLQRHIEPEHLDHVLAWASTSVPEGIALIAHGTNGKNIVVSAHPVVAEVVNSADTWPDAAVWKAVLADAQEAGDSTAVGRIGYGAHTRDYFDLAREAWARLTALDQPGVRWMRAAAEHSHHQHRPASQIPPLERLLTLTEAEYGADDRHAAEILLELGAAFGESGRAAEARERFERALVIFERALGPNHLTVAATLAGLGSALTDQGRAGEARERLERALVIFERERRPDHPDIARTLGNLGGVWAQLEEPAEARDLHERALRMLEREFGPNHLEVAGELFNLGIALSELGETPAARGCFERALRIQERELGSDHTYVALTLRGLGSVQAQLREPALARDAYERALTIFEREFGPNHPEVARTLIGLGNVCSQLGEAALGRDLYERALTIFEREFGPNHPEVARALVNLGNLLVGMGEQAEARKQLERAMRIFRASLPARHPALLRAEQSLRHFAPDAIVLGDGRIAELPPDAAARPSRGTES